jgi:hypothetical protein
MSISSAPELSEKGLRHRTMSAAAAEQLRRRILSGSYAAAHALRQDALAVEFAVSRIPVREASVPEARIQEGEHALKGSHRKHEPKLAFLMPEVGRHLIDGRERLHCGKGILGRGSRG